MRAAAAQARLERADRLLTRFRDFLLRRLVNAENHNRFALARGQLTEGAHGLRKKYMVDLRGRLHMGRRVGRGRMTAVERNPPLLADEYVAHDSEQPGTKAAAIVEQSALLESTFDAVLHKIIGVILIAGQDAGK